MSTYTGTELLEYADDKVYAVGLSGSQESWFPTFLCWDYPRSSSDDIITPRWVYNMTTSMRDGININFKPTAMKWDPHSDRIIVVFTTSTTNGENMLLCNLDVDGSIY